MVFLILIIHINKFVCKNIILMLVLFKKIRVLFLSLSVLFKKIRVCIIFVIFLILFKKDNYGLLQIILTKILIILIKIKIL